MEEKQLDKQRERALIRAVELYYYEGMTQAAISDRLGCTRWTVGRLLKEAADQGIVKVSIQHPRARSNQLEQQLKRAYGLTGARVIPNQPSKSANLALVALGAADYISDLRPRPQIVCVNCGRTTSTVAYALEPNWIPKVSVVPTCGVPGGTAEKFCRDLVRTFAKRGRGTWQTITSPVYADSVDAASRWRDAVEVSQGLDTASRADMFVYSPGLVAQDSLSAVYGKQTEEDVLALQQAGAVATVLNRYIDASGAEVDADLSARTLGVSLETLRSSKVSIVVASGVGKRAGLAAALAGRLATTVVTDSETAEYLLDTAP